MRIYMIVILPILILGVVGCTSAQRHTSAYTSPLLDTTLSGELIFHRKVTEADLPQIDLFFLTDEMKKFAADATKKGRNHDEKTELLHFALMSSIERGGRGIQYITQDTGTAKEVFEKRTANCLGYTLIFVAMARYLGLNAQVNQVMIPPTWYMGKSNTQFLMKHVNAKVKLRRLPSTNIADGRIRIADVSDVIVDLNIRRYRSNYPQKILGNSEVEALFYNNKAMEILEEGNYEQSFVFLKRALKSSNENYIWSNVGSLYRRLDMLQYAEVAYQKALSLNTKDLSVLHNLYALYQKMDRDNEAEAYRQKVLVYRAENPYYLYQLAMRAKNHKDVQSAKKLIESAIKREKKDDRLFLLAAEVYELDGDTRKAQKMRTKAAELKPIRWVIN